MRDQIYYFTQSDMCARDEKCSSVSTSPSPHHPSSKVVKSYNGITFYVKETTIDFAHLSELLSSMSLKASSRATVKKNNFGYFVQKKEIHYP